MTLRRIAVATIVAALGANTANAQHETPACDRECLQGFADAFMDAFIADDPGAARAAADVRATLNGDVATLAEVFWDDADATPYRMDIFDPEQGGVGIHAKLDGAGGPVVMAVRLKVEDDAITEVETIQAREGMADRLWDGDNLTAVSPNYQLSIRPAEQDSYYRLIATAEAYWRAFQTNATEDYRPAPFLPDVLRFENGLQTTSTTFFGEEPQTPGQQFDSGRFPGRNIWDRRYPVVDTEKGVVLSIVRFGLQAGASAEALGNRADRMVAEFFAVQNGQISEIQAVLINRPDAEPTGW